MSKEQNLNEPQNQQLNIAGVSGSDLPEGWMDWSGEIVFCNPPYSEVSKWVEKAYSEAKRGAKTVMLIPSRTDTKWFHEFIYQKHEIRFVKGRLKFGEQKNSAPFPSMVVVFS